MKIVIYNPAKYCMTGACGISVNPEVAKLYVALLQIQKQLPTVQVERYNQADHPQVFDENPAVAELLKNEGKGCLPLVFVDEELVSKGRYPGDEQFQSAFRARGVTVTLGRKKKSVSSVGPVSS